MRYCVRSVLKAVLVGVLGASGVLAAEPSGESGSSGGSSPFAKRWQVIAGGNLSSFETDAIAVSASSPIGVAIRLENDLGLEEEVQTYLIGVRYRLGRRHRLQLDWTSIQRGATRVIQRDIEFGDVTYFAGGVIDSRFDTAIARFKWGYDFSDTDRLDAGLTAGLSTFDIRIGLRGAGEIKDEDGVRFDEAADEGADFIAPVPVFGFYLTYAVTPKWTIRTFADAIELSISRNRGRVVETGIGSEFYFTRRFGLGFGLANQDIGYRTDDDDLNIEVDYRIQSVYVYASFVF